jgi:hypothetical protein
MMGTSEWNSNATENVFIIKIRTCGEFLHQFIRTVSITAHYIFLQLSGSYGALTIR